MMCFILGVRPRLLAPRDLLIEGGEVLKSDKPLFVSDREIFTVNALVASVLRQVNVGFCKWCRLYTRGLVSLISNSRILFLPLSSGNQMADVLWETDLLPHLGGSIVTGAEAWAMDATGGPNAKMMMIYWLCSYCFY